VLVAVVMAASAVAAAPQPAEAAGIKVVVVVGPVGSVTDRYITRAKSYAALARSYGATTSEIYTPNATWSRVKAAAQSANILIYLGHGNGWPSPHGSYNTTTKNGLGLNAYLGSGNTSTTYYGSGKIASEIRFAPGAVVLLNHLCYASGNGEPGMAEPTWDVARQRVDNYAQGFLAAGAQAVLADGHTSLERELRYLFGSARNLVGAWQADPDAHGNFRSFASQRTPGYTNYLDPDRSSSGFYRSLTTKPTLSTSTIKGSATVQTATATSLKGTAMTSLRVRSSASTSASTVATVASGARLTITGKLRTDSRGRTWAPVRTASGKTGFVAGWYTKFTGHARPTVAVVLRSKASTSSTAIMTVQKGTVVAVLGSSRDLQSRVWFNVKTSSGKTGWMAGWLMAP
jgi:hypothetical protein